MTDIRAQIAAALGSQPPADSAATGGAVNSGAATTGNMVALKNIASNGSFLLQNLSQLESSFDELLTGWGA